MDLLNNENVPIYVIIILIFTIIILVLSTIVLHKVDLIQNMKEKFTDSDKWSLIDWIFVILSLGIWKPKKKIFIPPPISTIKSFKAPSPRSLSEGDFSAPSPRSLSEGNFLPPPPGFIASMGDPRDINLTTIPTAQNHAGIFLPNTGSSLSATPSPSPLRPQTTFSAINTAMASNSQTNQMYLPAPAPAPTSQSIFSSINTESSMGSSPATVFNTQVNQASNTGNLNNAFKAELKNEESYGINPDGDSVTQTSSPSPSPLSYSFISSPGPSPRSSPRPASATVFNTQVNQASNTGNLNNAFKAELKNEESYGINPDGDSVTQTSSPSPSPLSYSSVSSPGPAFRSSPGPASTMSAYNKLAATYNITGEESQSQEFSNNNLLGVSSITQTSSLFPLSYSSVSSPGPAPRPASTYSSTMSSYNKRAATYNNTGEESQSQEFSN